MTTHPHPAGTRSSRRWLAPGNAERTRRGTLVVLLGLMASSAIGLAVLGAAGHAAAAAPGAAAAPAAAASPAAAAPPAADTATRVVGHVRLTASVEGQPLAGSSGSHPVRLLPRADQTLAIRIVNDSSVGITARTVRLSGTVMGLPFFSYDTTVDLPVGAHRTATLDFAVDLSSLSGAATGLMPGGVTVLGPLHRQLASQTGVMDVRGSFVSVYGLFGLAVLVFTLGTLLGALVALARHRLPANRWRRGLRFLTPGAGIGLVLIFTLSAFRVFVPRTSHWVMLLVIPSVVLFAFGYLTPTPVGDADEDEDDQDEDDQDEDDQDEDDQDEGDRDEGDQEYEAQLEGDLSERPAVAKGSPTGPRIGFTDVVDARSATTVAMLKPRPEGTGSPPPRT